MVPYLFNSTAFSNQTEEIKKQKQNEDTLLPEDESLLGYSAM
jgi:hypothetical protein